MALNKGQGAGRVTRKGGQFLGKLTNFSDATDNFYGYAFAGACSWCGQAVAGIIRFPKWPANDPVPGDEPQPKPPDEVIETEMYRACRRRHACAEDKTQLLGTDGKPIQLRRPIAGRSEG